MTIIDCHVHLNHYEGTKYLPLDERKELLLHTMQDGNVDHSIILSSYKVNPDRPSTKQLIEVTKKHDNLSIVAGFSIDGHNDGDFQNSRNWPEESLIRSMKLYCCNEHY